jgi:SAM-dependent methyltransferase
MDFDNEEKHYRFHNNDANDKGYQNFVSPITSAIQQDFNTKDTTGLDFGSGTDSPIFKILKDNKIKQFDVYFHNHLSLLEKQYNYIACCEVVEHFHHPDKEFQLFKKLLLPKGKLYIMTHIYDTKIDFSSWYYKNDHTHVFMYQRETMEWICKTFGFSEVKIENRLIVFSN